MRRSSSAAGRARSLPSEDAEDYSIRPERVERRQDAHLIMMPFNTFADAARSDLGWLQTLVVPSGADLAQLSTLSAKMTQMLGRRVGFDLEAFAAEQLCNSPYREAAKTTWNWRQTLFRCWMLYHIGRKNWGGIATFPSSRQGRNIGFLLPLVEFGGGEGRTQHGPHHEG